MLLPLLEKLGGQVEDVLRRNRGVSLLEKDLMKDTIKAFYETVEGLPVHVPVAEEPMIPVTPVALPAPVEIPAMEPVPAPPAGEEMERLTAVVPVAMVTPAHPEAGTIPVAAASSEDIFVFPAAAPVADHQFAAAPQAPVAEKVVETRTRHLHAAARFEEQATVAAKYAAPETISDKVTREGSSVRLADQLKTTPLADLKASIGINERFAFINELFGGDQQAYLHCIDQLNQCATFEAAQQLLREEPSNRYNWSGNAERVHQLEEFVKRRFHA